MRHDVNSSAIQKNQLVTIALLTEATHNLAKTAVPWAARIGLYLLPQQQQAHRCRYWLVQPDPAVGIRSSTSSSVKLPALSSKYPHRAPFWRFFLGAYDIGRWIGELVRPTTKASVFLFFICFFIVAVMVSLSQMTEGDLGWFLGKNGIANIAKRPSFRHEWAYISGVQNQRGCIAHRPQTLVKLSLVNWQVQWPEMLPAGTK